MDAAGCLERANVVATVFNQFGSPRRSRRVGGRDLDVLPVIVVVDPDGNGFQDGFSGYSASSISRGAMFSPPLMMSSLERPVMKK